MISPDARAAILDSLRAGVPIDRATREIESRLLSRAYSYPTQPYDDLAEMLAENRRLRTLLEST